MNESSNSYDTIQTESLTARRHSPLLILHFPSSLPLRQNWGNSMGGSSFSVQWLPPFLLLTFVSSINASIHLYDHQGFREVGNSYLLSGGSEGIVASPNPSIATSRVHSFIRYSYPLCRFFFFFKFFYQICAWHCSIFCLDHDNVGNEDTKIGKMSGLVFLCQ